MFNTTNDQTFNRHHTRYHPYNRVSSNNTSYYPVNEYETYSYDHNTNITPQNYDYNLNWTTPCSSSIDNEVKTEPQPIVGGIGRVKFYFQLEYRKILIHSKVLLIVSNDVYQLIKKNVAVHNQ